MVHASIAARRDGRREKLRGSLMFFVSRVRPTLRAIVYRYG